MSWTRLEPGGPTDLPPAAGQIKKSPYKKKANDKNNTVIVIDPNRENLSDDDKARRGFKEEAEGSHAFTIGGFSPFTKGHESVVNHMKDQKHSSVSVFTTTSSKRPISAEKKVGYIKKAVGEHVHVGTAQTPLHAASELYKAGKRGHVTFYGGSDRADIANRIKHYNGKEGGHGFYNFKSITFKQVGSERKEGSEGLAGVSGTKARASKSPEELKKYLPKSLHPHAKDIFKDIHEELKSVATLSAEEIAKKHGVDVDFIKKQIQVGAKIEREHTKDDETAEQIARDHLKEKPNYYQKLKKYVEHVEIEEEKGRVVSLQQRMRRAVIAKRNKAKLEIARKLAKKRMAGAKQLKRRSQKLAKRLVRMRAAGTQRGASYASMSTSEKLALDRMVATKSPVIQKIAKKIMPRVKQREIQRLSGVSAAKRTGIPMVASYELKGRLLEKLEAKVKRSDVTEPEVVVSDKPHSMERDIPHRKGDRKDPRTMKHNLEIFRKIIEDCGLEEDFMDSVMARLLEKESQITPTSLKGFRIKNTKEKIVVGIPAKGQAAKPTSGPRAGLQIPTAIRQTEEKDLIAIQEKAEETGIPYDILKKIYDRGMKATKPPTMTNQQAAFARLASFIAKGKSYQKEDADLAEGLKKVDKNPFHREWGTTSLANLYKAGTPGQEGNVKEDLRKWFKQKWVRMDTKGNIKGDCAREPGEGKPKCLPLAKARAMDKEDRATAARRKRREDPVADRAGKGNPPVNVRTEEVENLEEKNTPTNPKLWAQAKSLAKSKFDVYPSAYANGWAAKWYKARGGGWKSVSEEVDIPDKTTRKLKKITKQLDKSSVVHHKQSVALKKLISKDEKDVKEEKNCGCGQTPCITYGPKNENFMDGKNPEDKGDMARHGLKGKSIAQLKKVRSSETASPRAKQLAHWFINMNKGKK